MDDERTEKIANIKKALTIGHAVTLRCRNVSELIERLVTTTANG